MGSMHPIKYHNADTFGYMVLPTEIKTGENWIILTLHKRN